MRMVRRSLTLLAAMAFSLSIAVGPVYAAAKTMPSWACAPWESGTARGEVADAQGRVREKSTGQVAKALPARAQGKAPSSGVLATVPVYWHIVTDGSTGSYSDGDVRAQIRVLNAGFSGGEGGADVGLRFELAGITRTDNAEWFALETFAAESDMKQALKQGDAASLNVYSTSGAGFLGWAYYPSIVGTDFEYLDGVVLNWESLKGVSDTFEGRYDLGKTLTHEAGHWINLAHTFEGKCGSQGDFVDDTPKQRSPTAGCPEGKDTCPAPGLDPIHNYMDYSFDACYSEFTPGQVQRARDAWLFYRAA